MVEEADPRFVIAPSTIPGAGRGLFAKVALRAGERLEVLGVLVQSGSAADDCTRFADPYKFRVGDQLLIPLDYAALVNHASVPNCEKVVEAGRVYLRALRTIDAGEELFFCYSDYTQKRFGLS